MSRGLLLFLLANMTWAMPAHALPHLKRQGSATQLVVNGRPMLVIGGELGNSSASSAAYMAPHWPRLKAMHLSVVIAPVSWELIEPTEGRFDWSSVDRLIGDARKQDMKLVLLWFGAWKNSMSTYVPAWVKHDQQRFPRAQNSTGTGLDILSAFAPANLDADRRAFVALLDHLEAIDSRQETVVLVQVENEIGMLPVARDHGVLAEAALARPVPSELVDYLVRNRERLEPELRSIWEKNGAKTKGGWNSLFGEGDAAAEIFTAWYYARFADALAAAGKAAYPLPMYVNVALNRPGKAPGEYPSGGPLPHLIDVWKAGAPTIDLIAPDIYFANFVDILDRYRRPDNPIFIPEAQYASRPEAAANAFYAFGEADAIGFSPFSIESIDGDPDYPLARAYAILRQLEPYILAAQGSGRMTGFKPRQLYDETVISDPVTRQIGDYRFTVSFDDGQAGKATVDIVGRGGLIIQIGPEEYLIAGQGITVTMKPTGEGSAGIESTWEGMYDAGGHWVSGRLLNGDQTHQGRHIRLPAGDFQIQRVRLYRYY